MSDGRNYPVCYVSWKNAMAFCEWLTIRETKGKRLPEGYAYRLPTEAEWEYCASRGGAVEDPELTGLGWYMKNSKTNQPTQQLRASQWGLYDMFGNVWELCYDYYGRYKPDEVSDPIGPRRGVLRVMRGGSHSNPADLCRPSYRSSVGWTDARSNVGFRVVLAPTIEELRKSMSPGAIVRSGEDDESIP
jgi:formylglycine-generating enzyme required for sulfatase activity